MSIITKLQEIIAEQLQITPHDVRLLDSFLSLGIDSLDHIQLIQTCEEFWNIEICDDVAAACTTVADLHQAILLAVKNEHGTTLN